MIIFDLLCTAGHRFEGWFASSDEYARQSGRDLVACPVCGSVAVEKAPMAPAVPRKGNRSPAAARTSEPAGEQAIARASAAGTARGNAPAVVRDGGHAVARSPLPPHVAEALTQLARAQAKALEQSRWVGDGFAGEARAMHYGEREGQPIHGRASSEEAERLVAEGIAIAPLPFPVTAPEDLN